jgi:hypothetical protein
MAIAGHWGNHYNSSCEIYDFATQQWTFTDSLEIGRTNHCSEKLLNNKILVMAGQGAGTSCEIYSNQWQTVTPLHYGRTNFSSETLRDEQVLVIGPGVCEIYTWNYTPTVTQPQGPNQGSTGEEVTFSITPSDPDGDSISVRFNWGDGEISPWSELVPSGTTLTFSHSWNEEGSYEVRAQVCDQWHLLNEQCHNSISEWSNPINIEITGTPLIQISTEPINFGQVLIGSDSTLSVFVSNSGNGLLEINTSTELPFSVGPENLSIQPEGEEEIVITFLPLSTGFFEEVLLVQSNDPENSEIEILLSGEGTELSSTTSPVLNITSLSAYPNPFNSELTISFSLAQVGPRQVKILIYNIKGQVIKTWTLNPGTTQVTWSGRDEDGNPVSSGVYFYRIKTGGDYQANGKVILLK